MAAGWHQGVAVVLQNSDRLSLVALRKGCMLSTLRQGGVWCWGLVASLVGVLANRKQEP